MYKILAPVGYHVPSGAELTALMTHLGGENYAGYKMKATTGWYPSDGIINTNSSGFTGLPNGYRQPLGEFYGIGWYGDWWTSYESSPYGKYYSLRFDFGFAEISFGSMNWGFSVRCVRD